MGTDARRKPSGSPKPDSSRTKRWCAMISRRWSDTPQILRKDSISRSICAGIPGLLRLSLGRQAQSASSWHAKKVRSHLELPEDQCPLPRQVVRSRIQAEI
jgi:hypothetical protein